MQYLLLLSVYDPRLFGEIHITLLRSIIKDIEDVARTPSTGLGANQNSAANPGGGHPKIVEEGNDGEDVIFNLRNGVAAENAVARMHERGYSHPRRSRKRLTPWTVKFASFHVLSLERSDGLSILEVADKIQKSELRDLTTSKTPEASIAAALSRDSNLFERTASSTYCIRPAYRKDPSDSAAILSSARERIQVFKSGFPDGEEADDIERDEDSESDVAQDPEVDDIGNELIPKKVAEHSFERDEKNSLENEKETPDAFMDNPQGDLGNGGESVSSMHSEGFNEVKSASVAVDPSIDVAVYCNEAATSGPEDTDIDESNSGVAWVQGLMDGEYFDLSVEERTSW